jgi:hypothetical protein
MATAAPLGLTPEHSRDRDSLVIVASAARCSAALPVLSSAMPLAEVVALA